VSERNQKRLDKGQSLIETMTAFFVLIPIGLVAIDVVALVSSSQQNEQLAEMAARAASTKSGLQNARDSAQDALTRFQTNSIMYSVSLDDINYDAAGGTVSVATVMDVRMPIPFPYFNQVNCRASSLQPLVSMPVVN
jgi:Flp pilus assembly protein TadG